MNLLKYIIPVALAVTFTACDDFLEETPKTQLNKDGIYESYGSANAVLAGMYSKVSDYDYVGFNYFHVVNVTSGVGVSIKQNDVNLTSMNILPSNVNVGKVYISMYSAINVANDIIQGLADKSFPNRDRILGEAKYIRALTYFNLVRLYGRVSLIEEPCTDYASTQYPRADVDDVYTLIEQDLQDAFGLMAEPGKQAVGFPHRYAAKALLAKVYLTRAGNEDGSPYWRKAYDAAYDVYLNGGYSLVRPYASLFGSPNKNNAESIFEVQYSANINSGRFTETTFPVGHPLMDKIPTRGKQWGKTRPSQMLFSMFDQDDPRREASFVFGSYTNIYETNAKKKNVMLFPTKKKEGNKANLSYSQGDSEYPAWKKYYDPSMTAQSTNTNFVFQRYADVLLILAEAGNELGEPTAPDFLRMVLDRARDANGDGAISADEVYPLDLTAAETADKAALRERILYERLREFTGECDEWYTIRRRGEDFLRQIMERHNAFVDQWYSSQKITTLPKFVYKYDVSATNVRKNMLLPFPADEINRNEAINQSDQNFGY